MRSTAISPFVVRSERDHTVGDCIKTYDSKGTSFDKTDFRKVVPRFTPQALEANRVLIDLIETIAREKDASKAEIALAWLLALTPAFLPQLALQAVTPGYGA